MTNNWLLTPKEIKINDLYLVGRKAFNLATLSRNHFLIPQSLVVTTQFFQTQISHYAYSPIWAGSPDVAVTEGALQFLADFLKSTPLAPHLEMAFQESLSKLFPPQITEFAVRSSAIDEDEYDRSFAGCYLSELDVPRNLLSISLTRCWASALTGAALQYRLDHGMPIQSIQIAVIIQPMLQPQSAGVGFTLNPVSGSRDEIVIEATSGLGSTVVSGDIIPARYHVGRQFPAYPILHKNIDDQSGPQDDPLSESQIAQMGQAFEQIEALMGTAQDIEWAYQDDEFYLLQTRPISVAPATSTGDDVEWVRISYAELFPDIPSPLFISLTERVQSRLTGFLKELALDTVTNGQYVKLLHGRLFFNLNLIRKVHTKFGLDSLSLLMALNYIELEGGLDDLGFSWTNLWQHKTAHRLLFSQLKGFENLIFEYEKMVLEIGKKLSEPIQSLSQDLAIFKFREQVYGETLHLNLYLMVGIIDALALLSRIMSVPDVVNLVQAFSGLSQQDEATAHTKKMIELAQLAQTEAKVVSYLHQATNDFSGYQQILAGTEFLSAFEAYLGDYGHRANYVFDLGQPRYRENPPDLLKNISRYIGLLEQNHDFSLDLDLTASAQQIIQHLRTYSQGWGAKLPPQSFIAKRLIQQLQQLFQWKQRLNPTQSKIIATIRAWDLRMAETWVAENLLDQVDDYFWLNLKEIERALVSPNEAGVHLKPAISTRKATYLGLEHISLPLRIWDSEIPKLSLTKMGMEDVSLGTLVGLPVSPGQIQGVIKIVDGADDLAQIPAGSILVMPSNDPSFAPFFAVAGG